MNRTVVWFRRDLRIADHGPLYRAVRRGQVIPLFILDRALLHHPETASARVGFMLACLRSLDNDLRQYGGRLILRLGDPAQILPQLVRETESEGVYAYLDYERIYGRVRDDRVNRALNAEGMKIRWFEPVAGTGELLSYPDYRTLWFDAVRAAMVPTPNRIDVPDDLQSDPLPHLIELGLMPDDKWIPPAGTGAARQLLQEFFREKRERYYWQLSYPGASATTGLSPHIKFGAISVRECYQLVQRHLKGNPDPRVQRSRRQLISRLRWGSGFAQRFRYLPQLELRSLYSVFDQEGWDFDEELYNAWRLGHTGFPIVDAAARCLLATGGWQALNFRSRAIYSSFLGNLLGMDWRFGALHFMQHLIDGDCPIDHYQWAMQSGVTHCADKTWTRIYNPEQAAVDRCDPEGAFIKQWLPELAELPVERLGSPPAMADYPAPILDYRKARQLRVKQLERQRGQFLKTTNIVPSLARMPEDWTPFGSDRGNFDVGWAQTQALALFPPALDLDALEEAEAKRLRTWFVAHVNIKPHAGFGKKRRRKRTKDDGVRQLQLFDVDAWVSTPDAVAPDGWGDA